MSIFLLLILIIFLIALRFSLPYLAQYKPALAKKLSDAIGQSVAIAEMQAYWEGWTPWVILNDVSIQNSTTSIKKMKAKLSLFGSLIHRRVIIKKIVIDGGEFIIQQMPDKSYTVNKIKIPTLAGASTASMLVHFKNLNVKFFNENIYIQLHHVDMIMDEKFSLHANNVEVAVKEWVTKPFIFDNMSANFHWSNKDLLQIDAATFQNNFLQIAGKLNVDLKNPQPQFEGLFNYTVSPVEPFSEYILQSDRFHFSGNRLKGQINIHGSFPESLSGNILLNDIAIQNKDKIILQKINGEILFAYPKVNSKILTAELLKDPVNIQFTNDEINANGKLNIAELIKIPELKFLEKIAEGRADFQAKLNWKKNNFMFDSNLQGIKILLPKPFQKTDSEIMPLHIQAEEKNSEMLVDVTYSNKIAASILAENEKNKWDITSANIVFGGGKVTFPDKKGIYVSGHISEFNVLDWKDYFLENASSNQSFVFSVNVDFGKLSVAGIPLNQTNLQAKPLPDNWYLKLVGPSVNAEIWIPKNENKKSLRMVVKKIYVTSHTLMELTKSTENKLTMSSSQIPSLDLYFQKFYYDKSDVGAIRVLASKAKNGLLIDKVMLESPNINFIMKGSWIGDRSCLCGHIRTTNFGDFLRDWEITESLDGSEGTLDFNLNWRGPVYDMNFSTLNGKLTVSLSDGVILDIVDSNMEMVGKILNIFSVDSLEFLLSKPFGVIAPKRKGFDFEVQKADFTIRNGDLKTKDFYLYGRLAEVDANGSIGLVTHDYNLNVSITPLLTAFLPMNLALAGGPVIYGTVWLADKLMSGILNGFFRQDYHVTGTWRHPIYQKVKD